MTDYKSLLRIRTVTCFVTLQPDSFQIDGDASSSSVDSSSFSCPTIQEALNSCFKVKTALQEAGYTVQSVRLATNPFGEWLPSTPAAARVVLEALDQWLRREQPNVAACSLGPSMTLNEVSELCPLIIQTSPLFSCSANLAVATDVDMARACARCVQQIAQTTTPSDFMQNGLGNFRFAVAACCPPLFPFFPVAKAPSSVDTSSTANQQSAFAIGLENGPLAQHLLKQCQSIQHIPTIFHQGMTDAILPIQKICEDFVEATTAQSSSSSKKITFAGIDSSLNPSLDATGSVAAALECVDEVSAWGEAGTLATAAALTKSLQSLPVMRTGYCGIMLPVCEDTRLAELTDANPQLRLVDLLSISSVCGVGIDTVPLPGNVTEERLAALMLDVAGLATRWNKPLSCRVFPLRGKVAGEQTTFDFPHMINAAILQL